jgi:hypothetical protein
MEMIGPVTIDGMPCYYHIAFFSAAKNEDFSMTARLTA